MKCAALLVLAMCGWALAQAPMSSSALIAQAMDSQLTDLSLHGSVVDVMKAVESQTGVHLEAEPAVWDALPWGEETSLTVHLKNCTVRQALDSITRRLGLEYSLGDEAVDLTPSPPLARIGRRSTLDEVRVLDDLARTPAELPADATVQQVLDATDAKLAETKSPFAVQDRLADAGMRGATIHIAHNASLMDALEQITHQTNATWYPWGHSLVITTKVDAVHLLLSKHLTRQFHTQPLPQVLADLASTSGVLFSFTPGVLQKVPPKFQQLTLRLDDATVEQALQMISGATGLQFAATDQGVSVTLAK